MLLGKRVLYQYLKSNVNANKTDLGERSRILERILTFRARWVRIRVTIMDFQSIHRREILIASIALRRCGRSMSLRRGMLLASWKRRELPSAGQTCKGGHSRVISETDLSPFTDKGERSGFSPYIEHADLV